MDSTPINSKTESFLLSQPTLPAREPPSPTSPTITVDPFWVFIVGGSLLWGGLILTKFQQSRQQALSPDKKIGPNLGVLGSHRVPCKQCHYFSHNLYLKCTVHPDTVMTKRAIDCPDFCQRGSNRL